MPLDEEANQTAKRISETKFLELNQKVTHDYIVRTMRLNERADEKSRKQAEEAVEKTLGNQLQSRQQPHNAERLEAMVKQMSKDLREMKGKLNSKSGSGPDRDGGSRKTSNKNYTTK